MSFGDYIGIAIIVLSVFIGGFILGVKYGER